MRQAARWKYHRGPATSGRFRSAGGSAPRQAVHEDVEQQFAAAGGASGLFSTAQQIGGAVGIAVIGTVFFGSVGNHSLVTAFTHTAPYAAGAFLVRAALSLVLPKTAVADDHG